MTAKSYRVRLEHTVRNLAMGYGFDEADVLDILDAERKAAAPDPECAPMLDSLNDEEVRRLAVVLCEGFAKFKRGEPEPDAAWNADAAASILANV